MTHVYRIGEVAARTGCSPESIRHYEKLGLLPPHNAVNRATDTTTKRRLSASASFAMAATWG